MPTREPSDDVDNRAALDAVLACQGKSDPNERAFILAEHFAAFREQERARIVTWLRARALNMASDYESYGTTLTLATEIESGPGATWQHKPPVGQAPAPESAVGSNIARCPFCRKELALPAKRYDSCPKCHGSFSFAKPIEPAREPKPSPPLPAEWAGLRELWREANTRPFDASLNAALEMSEARERFRNATESAILPLLDDHQRLAERVEALEGELNDERTMRVNDYADAGRLVAWLEDDDRKPAHLQFTAGPERDLAYRIEAQLTANGPEAGKGAGDATKYI